jgi:DNA-binding transcriptional LysR family regulator
VAVIPNEHPLAPKKSISLISLKDEDFVLLGPQSALHAFCLRACKKEEFTPRIVYTGTRVENIMEMVSQGMGVSLLMEIPARFAIRPHAIIIPIAPVLHSKIVIARCRKHALSSAGKVFWKFFQQATHPPQ